MAARLDTLMEVTLAVASLDYTKKAPVTDQADIVDGVATALNLMMDELHASTTLATNVIDAMTDALVVTDQRGVIESINRAALELFGYTERELVGQPAVGIFSGLPEGLDAEHLARALRSSSDAAMCLTSDGRLVPISLTLSPMRSATGEIRGLVWVARDITERKQAEEERERLQAAIARQAAMLMELSTPIIPIGDQIVVMPLVGAVDADRARQVVEALVRGVAASRSRAAILDVTGVSAVDAEVADMILRAVRTVRLIGAQVVLTGVRPDVAQTLVTLGIDLSGVITRGTLKSGISAALAALEAKANGPAQ